MGFFCWLAEFFFCFVKGLEQKHYLLKLQLYLMEKKISLKNTSILMDSENTLNPAERENRTILPGGVRFRTKFIG